MKQGRWRHGPGRCRGRYKDDVDGARPAGTPARLHPLPASDKYGSPLGPYQSVCALERDDFSLNRHSALASCLSIIFFRKPLHTFRDDASCLSIIFSENRCTLFGMMLLV